MGLSLGLIWTPCVGPIMASVISLALTQHVDGGSVSITLAYTLGTSIPMLGVMLGGRALLNKVPALTRNSGNIQKGFGVLMIVVGVAIGLGWDRQFQSFILRALPGYGTGLTAIEKAAPVQSALKTSAAGAGDEEGGRGCRRVPGARSRAGKRAAGRLRRGAGLRDHGDLVQHRGSLRGARPDLAGRHHAADAGKPAGQGRGRGLLDLQLRELRAHPAVSQGVVRRLPGQGTGDRRRAHPRVRVREEHGERGARDPRAGRHLARRPGQRLRGVERVRQPVLAGALLHRCEGQGALLPLRGRRVRRLREGDPVAAEGSRCHRR